MNSTNLGNIVTSFSLYKFLDALTTPFTQTEAYRLGIIDANGNLLKQVDKLNNRELAAYNEFYRLVYSLKRLLLKIPDPTIRAQLTNVSSAVRLIAEECSKIGADPEDFYIRGMRELEACRLVEEGEGAAMGTSVANSVSGGGIQGMKPEDIGVPERVRQEISSGKRPSIFKRKSPNKYWLNAEKN